MPVLSNRRPGIPETTHHEQSRSSSRETATVDPAQNRPEKGQNSQNLVGKEIVGYNTSRRHFAASPKWVMPYQGRGTRSQYFHFSVEPGLTPADRGCLRLS